VVSAGLLWYYLSHLEKDPITGRTKFIAINHEQLLQIAHIELAMQMELYQDKFLPPSHPAYERVVNVANRLIESNQEIPQLQRTKWLVTVVNEPSITNAFVLPSGHIFIFTGILNKCSNDDQLCLILSHEISHVLLSHVAEQFSSLHLMDILVMVPLVFIWAVLPEVAAIVTHWLSGFFSDVLFRLPFSRALEVEADLIGLQLTAKACYDVREASVFWAKMSTSDPTLEWLSTHPSSETRQLILDALMPRAIQLRDQCKCPRLPLVDPRTLRVTGPERSVFA
jgi:Zn-dependent protease with chaperone function